jgi:xanthine dehydrogenase accessory factor
MTCPSWNLPYPHPQSVLVVVEEFLSLLKTFQPAILVDARMRKRQQPEDQRGLAPLTIGLGPNFIAGENIDLAVETSWGDALGQVIYQGATLPLRGEPRPLAGHARDRYVYAPTGGVFSTELQVGDTVQAGQVVAWVDATPLHAPLSGRLRGLTHTGVPVGKGTKVIEVDPRPQSADIAGIAERPRRIAEGVLQAIQS